MDDAATRLRLKIIVTLAVSFIALVAFVLYNIWRIPSEPEISVTFAGYTNRPLNLREGIWTLKNPGECTLQINPLYTIYWKTSKEQSDNDARHVVGTLASNIVLHPGNQKSVLATSPQNAVTWRADFSFTIKPDPVSSAVQRVLQPLIRPQRIYILYCPISPWTPEESVSNISQTSPDAAVPNASLRK